MAKIEHIQTVIAVPSSFDEEQRQIVARAIIDKIQENTKAGLNRYGAAFPKYSKEYKESLDFSNAGKNSTPNLELTGDMMASIDVISTASGRITIGYKATHPDADKVEGNQIGSYGSPEANKAKARPFIGLPQKDVDLIVAKVQASSPEQGLFNSFLDSVTNSLLKGVKNEP